MKDDRRIFKANDFVRYFLADFDTLNIKKYLYKVHGFIEKEKSGEKVILLQSLNDGTIYGKEYNEFIKEVDKNKYPDAKQKYYYEKVSVLINDNGNYSVKI